MSEPLTVPRSRKVKFLAFWSPRIGGEAASLRWRWANSLNLAQVLLLVSLPCTCVGGWAHVPILVPIGIAIYLGQGAILVLASLRLKASNAAASRALGFKIGIGAVPGPPRPKDAYERWCEKHGVTPYSANR